MNDIIEDTVDWDRLVRSLGMNPRRRTRLNLWQALKNYFNEYMVGELVTRRGLVESLRNLGFTNVNTIDTYRNYLCVAGYHETMARGIYKVIKEIPIDIPIQDVREEAYNPYHLTFDELEDNTDIIKVKAWSSTSNGMYYTDASTSNSTKPKKKKEFLKEEDFMV